MVAIIINTKVKLSFKNYISNFMIKYIIYITLKLYDKKTALGVVINKVITINGRKDCGPKNKYLLQKNSLNHNMFHISFCII